VSELYAGPLQSFEVKSVEMLAFFVFSIEWEEDKIMLEFYAPRDSGTFERKWLGWCNFFAR